jgi:lipid-A-disaccharide synthase-like uncharacterized protein
LRESSTIAENSLVSRPPRRHLILAKFEIPQNAAERALLIFGLAGQFVFFMRFAVQWYVSEKRKRSHIPVAFWYLSLGGGIMTFIYAWLRGDIVFTLSQGLGTLIYVRNLMLIYGRRARISARSANAAPPRT